MAGTGAQYQKINGVWTLVTRPYVKRGGVWMPVQEVWVKESGVWTKSWYYDVTPPQQPEISLQIVDNRYIKVGLRSPSSSNDPQLQRMRLLYRDDGKFPSTQFGSYEIKGSDNDYPNEEWSNFWYNNSNPTTHGGHSDSSVFVYKQYPLNPTSKTNLPGGKYYYFGAWAEDKAGNWSAGTQKAIYMPKEGVKAAPEIYKEMRALPISAGSLNLNGVTFTPGPVTANASPRSNGIWYLGNRITDSVGSQGTPTFSTAEIRVTRLNDTGQPTANVQLYWHGHATPGDVPIPSSDQNDPTVVGTINKGQTKTFNIPSSWHSLLNTQIKGFGLRYGENAQDYISCADLGTDMRCGEVHLIWKEPT